MNTVKLNRFKGQIENYLNQYHNAFESRIDKLFKELCVKTCLYRSRIHKKDGVHTSYPFCFGYSANLKTKNRS